MSDAAVKNAFNAACQDLTANAMGLLYRRFTGLAADQELPSPDAMMELFQARPSNPDDLATLNEVKDFAELIEQYDPEKGVSWEPDRYSQTMSQGPDSSNAAARLEWAQKLFVAKMESRARLASEEGVFRRLWNPETKEFEDEDDEEGTLSYRMTTDRSSLQDVAVMFSLAPAMLIAVNRPLYSKITATCRLPVNTVIILEDDVPEDMYAVVKAELQLLQRERNPASYEAQDGLAREAASATDAAAPMAIDAAAANLRSRGSIKRRAVGGLDDQKSIADERKILKAMLDDPTSDCKVSLSMLRKAGVQLDP